MVHPYQHQESLGTDYWDGSSCLLSPDKSVKYLANFKTLTGFASSVLKCWHGSVKSKGKLMIFPPARYPAADHSVDWQPRQVLLFSGHMIDAPNRNLPRFPAEKAPLAAGRIMQTLDELQTGPLDLALTQGANGGDILFAEACLKRGVHLQLLQPFDEPQFIKNSVTPAEGDWLNRYLSMTAAIQQPPLAASAELGELPPHLNSYERCNLWLLDTALAYGPEKLIFVCLWDGGGGDGPGGTAHMLDEVKKRRGRVVWLDTRDIFKI